MIVTVTPSPGLDLTYRLAAPLDPDAGEVIRAQDAGLEASGKGVNVSRTLAALGVPTIAVLPAGGATGRHLLDLLEADGVAHRAVPVRTPTRVNTSLLQPDGRTTKVNAPGAPLAPDEADALVDAVRAALAGQRDNDDLAQGNHLWLAVCGSVPSGGLVERLVEAGHEAGAKVAVDSSAAALIAAAEAGADLLAPNGAELAGLTGGSPATTLEATAADAAGVARRTGGELLVTLGEHGLLWTDGRTARHAAGPVVTPVNTAGAGDTALSAWLADPGAALDARLARAAAWGAAACLSPTTVAPVASLQEADAGVAPLVHVQPVTWNGASQPAPPGTGSRAAGDRPRRGTRRSA